MDHLGGGVPSKEADTTGLFIDGPGQVFHARGDGLFQIPPVGPVLAEEAVEIAGPVEYRQILISVFRSRGIRKMGVPCAAATRADPCRTTIGGESVVIPMDYPL